MGVRMRPRGMARGDGDGGGRCPGRGRVLATQCGSGASPVAAATVVQGFGRAVDTSALESYRGGTQTLYQTVNDARLSGTVTDNAAINVATGANIVRDGSFANASGIPTIIQNTGANVLIQNATIVNVQFRP